MQFSVKVIIAVCAVVGVAELGRHRMSNKAKGSSAYRRSLRMGNAGTTGTTQLFGFVDTFSASSNDDGASGAIADFGTDDVIADSSNGASVDPAGAPDSASGSTFATLNFNSEVDAFASGDDDAVATGSSGGSGGIVSFFDSGAASTITPTMVIPGTATNATIMTKGTKGTKSTGGDGAAAAVPGVEMAGLAIGSQGVNATAATTGESSAFSGPSSFATVETFGFFDVLGDASQGSTSAAGPTQGGGSGLSVRDFGSTNATADGGFGNASAIANGSLNVTGSSIGSGFSTFDNTTTAP